MLLLRTNVANTNPGAIKLRRDQVLQGDNNGVRFLADFARPFSYVAGAPTDGKAITDIAEKSPAGAVKIKAGQTVTIAGNGLDFSALTDKSSYAEIPAEATAGLFATQYYMVVLYVKLPIQSDWNTNAALAPFFSGATGSSGYATNPELVTIFQSNSPQLVARRQTALNVVSATQMTIPVADYGQFAQIAYYRNAGGMGCG